MLSIIGRKLSEEAAKKPKLKKIMDKPIIANIRQVASVVVNFTEIITTTGCIAYGAMIYYESVRPKNKYWFSPLHKICGIGMSMVKSAIYGFFLPIAYPIDMLISEKKKLYPGKSFFWNIIIPEIGIHM